jgi:hypothetical protein
MINLLRRKPELAVANRFQIGARNGSAPDRRLTSPFPSKGETMTSLKTLGGSVVLTLALSIAAFADDGQQCMNPGQTGTMPCSTAQMAVDETSVDGATNGAPVVDSIETAITETAIDLLQSVLLLA